MHSSPHPGEVKCYYQSPEAWRYLHSTTQLVGVIFRTQRCPGVSFIHQQACGSASPGGQVLCRSICCTGNLKLPGAVSRARLLGQPCSLLKVPKRRTPCSFSVFISVTKIPKRSNLREGRSITAQSFSPSQWVNIVEVVEHPSGSHVESQG